MPVYEFECKKCKVVYDALSNFDKTGKYKNVICPECGSKSKKKMMSSPNFAFSNPEGTDRWNNTSTGHDYRFKHKIHKVKQERKIAEAVSHMGTDPYGSADMLKKDIEMDTGIHDAKSRKGLS